MVETNSRKIIKRLESEGFTHVSIRGSHHKFTNGTLTIIIPHPKNDMPFGTARATAKLVGWI